MWLLGAGGAVRNLYSCLGDAGGSRDRQYPGEEEKQEISDLPGLVFQRL